MNARTAMWIFGVALAVSLCACAATTAPYNPFKTPQAEIKNKVKVVALAPVSVGVDNPDPVKAKFEALVTAKLQEGGFTVVPSTEYGAIWKQMTETLGGFFDPMTGKRDDQKFKTLRQHAMRELAAKTNADGLMEIAIVPVKVSFNIDHARWHGTDEYMRSGGAWAMFFGPQTSGTTTGLSLYVDLSDINDVDMYINFGGIQLLSKLSGNQFYQISRQELFNDEERNHKAVDIALNPLIGKAIEPEKPKASEEKSY